ncbi:hypothetical protein FHW68_004001 [Pseudomonas sp. Tn43]|uniref:hypothetical protein n=1 Tax=Pseudomonas sp. Tn43 TaxID=701213 RepID=UPI00161F864F|nr:hypothetical protein [Pseudomonas sp. Tn43]MBB3242459.1 hypothetical protein [Pseudomonas sp. Tn43]
MRISQPKLVFNPYDWLPGFGESKVSFRSVGVDLVLDVEYEKDTFDADGNEGVSIVRREIVFKCVHSFIKLPFPGSVIFNFLGDSSEFGLGELTEFRESEFLRSSLESWRMLTTLESPRLRHFSIQFLAENMAFHVLAEEVFLSSELSIM